MTIFEKAGLFFEPLRENKLMTFFAIIKFSFWGIHAISSVLILKYSIHAIEIGDESGFQRGVILFVVVMIFFFSITWIFRKTDWPVLYHRLEWYIYKKYLPTLIHLDNNYLESIGTGKMITIIKEGTKVWIDQLSLCIKEVTKISVTGGFLLYQIGKVDGYIGVGLVLSLILMHIIVVMIDVRAHKFRKIRTNEKSELSRRLVRMIMSKNEILQSNYLGRELDGVHQSVLKIHNANDSLNISLYFIFNLVRVFALGLRLLILIYMGQGVMNGIFSLSEFAGILAMIIVFESFLFESTEFYKNFTKEFSDIEKLWETLDVGHKMLGYDSGKIFQVKNQDIIINHVSYKYSKERIIDDLSLTMKRGQKTALVGASGGGKTTIMKLIAGYLTPLSGTISVLGNTLSETALKTYYPHIGYLTQEPSVFDGTIRENLLSVLREKEDSETEEKLLEALRLAQCEFVFSFEKGIDTEIGEKGIRLSGGQRQRLAIAKIFLKNPEIILLDEPTSALDSFSEEKITEAMHTLFEGRTVIVIAHRLQTVKEADDIIVIEGGKVVERGTHNSLIEKKGIYHKMLELQSGF